MASSKAHLTVLTRRTHSNTKLNVAAEVLAILFGVVIALAVVLLGAYYFLRRRYDRKRAKEHSFRLGAKSGGAGQDGATNMVIGAPMNFEHKESGGVDFHRPVDVVVGVPGSGYGYGRHRGDGTDSVARTSQRHLLSTTDANASSVALSVGRSTVSSGTAGALSLSSNARVRDRTLPSPPQSPGIGSIASSMTLATNTSTSGSSAVTKGSDLSSKTLLILPAAGTEDRTQESPVPGHARASPKPFAFLSQAPSAFQQIGIPGMKRMSKGDADSMKTDFLQV